MLISAGESLIDLIQRPSQGPNPIYEAAIGGSPYNCARAMARLGAPSGYLCPISNDPLGRFLREGITRSGVNVLLKEPSSAPTSLACVSLGSDGQPEYQFYRTGTADRDISVARLLAVVPDDVTLLNTGSLALTDEADAKVWTTVARTLADRGAVVSIDPNVRPMFVSDWTTYKKRIATLFDLATIVKISDEDLECLDMPVDPEKAGHILTDVHKCAVAIITNGSQGAVFINGNGIVEVPVFRPPEVIDTVGAGDTFMGGLLAEFHERDLLDAQKLAQLTVTELAEIGQFSAVAAGLNCAEKGCNPPTRETVLKTIASL